MKTKDEIRKEMSDSEWWELELRRVDIRVTEALVEAGNIVSWMEEEGYIVPAVPVLAIMKTEEAKTLVAKEEEKVAEKAVAEEKLVDLPGRGSQFPTVAFVGASMSSLDKIRSRHLSGMVGKTLQELYVEPLGLTMDDVYITSIYKDVVLDENGRAADPDANHISGAWDAFAKEMATVEPRFIVALGKTAAKYLGDNCAEWVPHPRAVRLLGDSGETVRKMSRLRKSIEKPDSTMSGTIIKSEDEKQIVYGVVMEPYENDSDENWTNQGEIENAAHSFMKNFRLIDANHSRVDIEAVPVESWVQHEDTLINGEPVKAGSWIMGVKVDDPAEWEKVKGGDYTGFSIDAFAHISPDLELHNS